MNSEYPAVDIDRSRKMTKDLLLLFSQQMGNDVYCEYEIKNLDNHLTAYFNEFLYTDIQTTSYEYLDRLERELQIIKNQTPSDRYYELDIKTIVNYSKFENPTDYFIYVWCYDLLKNLVKNEDLYAHVFSLTVYVNDRIRSRINEKPIQPSEPFEFQDAVLSTFIYTITKISRRLGDINNHEKYSNYRELAQQFAFFVLHIIYTRTYRWIQSNRNQ